MLLIQVNCLPWLDNAKKFQAKLEKILIQETQNNSRKFLTSMRISSEMWERSQLEYRRIILDKGFYKI